MVSYSFGSCNLFKNMYWIFGDGTNINIWHDIWFLGGLLRKLLEGPLQYREENNKVTTLRQSLNWDFDSLLMPIPEQIKSIIQGISVSLFQNTLDKLVWLENNGFYSVRFAFCGGPFCNVGVGLPPAILGPSILSKEVETGPTATHFSSACAQIMPYLPRTSFICPWQAELLRMSHGK